MAAHPACDPPAGRVRAIVAALALLTRGVLGHAAGRVATEEGPPRRYVGAAACSSNNCHGSVTPRLDSKRSMQNEYVTWYKSDRHAKAYEALVGERALRIARLLGMVDASAAAATWLKQTPRAERCLDCHTLNVPAGLRASKFNLEDGVSCEACHGPANAWLTKHTERGWDPAQSLGLGMLDTTDPGRAAETCLTCHLGTATKRVDHEMLAAGHPTCRYIATMCMSYALQGMNCVRKALSIGGPTFIHSLDPCPKGWDYDPYLSHEMGELAVTTGVWPLYEVEEGVVKLYGKTKEIAEGRYKRGQVREYLLKQGRFAHFKDEDIDYFQSKVDEMWEKWLIPGVIPFRKEVEADSPAAR